MVCVIIVVHDAFMYLAQHKRELVEVVGVPE